MNPARILNFPPTPEYFAIKVPASIANLGPGFDTLAVAVQLYLTLRVTVRPGCGELEFHFPERALCGDNHIERAYRYMAGDRFDCLPSLSVDVRSEIPMGAGLGSSAAATIAGLRLYEAMVGPLSQEMMLTAACALEGHPDNAAASLLGGLTVSCQLPDGSVCASKFRWPEALGFAVLTPETPLTTKQSRAVLPECVSRKDVVFNLQRLALLLQSLQSEDFSKLRQALNDRVHQPFRQNIVPGLAQALNLEHRDLLGVCLSGSGPSIVAIAESNLHEVGELLASVYESDATGYELRMLQAHDALSAPSRLCRSGVLCS
jgi:homoserine kinase